MKRIFIILYLIGSLGLMNGNLFAKANKEESLDKIIAVVNEDVITKSEFNRSMNIAKVQIAQQHAPVPSEEALNKQVLDQLINKKLQLQVAKAAGISVSDSELNSAIQRIAEQNQMSTATLLARISQDGMSVNDYKIEMRDQMTLQKLQQQEVVNRIVISPDEVTHFMNSKLWQDNNSKEYHLEDILIPVSDTPSPEEITTAKKHAQEVMAKIHRGVNFGTLAATDSGDAQALKGGDLGWRKLPEIPSAFAEEVVHLQAKEVAGPIQTSNGFHIIRLAEVRANATKEAAPSRKQIEDLLLQRKFAEAVQNWISKLRSQAFIDKNPGEKAIA